MTKIVLKSPVFQNEYTDIVDQEAPSSEVVDGHPQTRELRTNEISQEAVSARDEDSDVTLPL